MPAATASPTCAANLPRAVRTLRARTYAVRASSANTTASSPTGTATAAASTGCTSASTTSTPATSGTAPVSGAIPHATQLRTAARSLVALAIVVPSDGPRPSASAAASRPPRTSCT
ncbi:hypothetical protein GCM10009675_35470 [Prauserella alba]|uniref:Uncharacterized protein n=1 Tax=Prauserella alba TaxID=176898 RepID=A0ABN1VJJ7_9PSEU